MSKLYPAEVAGKDGWSDWIHPLPGYRMACCDCLLVHELELGETDDGRLVIRMRRNKHATAQLRRHRGVRVRKT